jgi:hypothetical protein
MKNLHVIADLIHLFAPTEQLRTSINMGNPILANRQPQTGEPFGVSVYLANSFADLWLFSRQWERLQVRAGSQQIFCQRLLNIKSLRVL